MIKKTADLALKCRCGKVTSVVRDVTPNCGNRLVCYCRDCQAFANHLERGSDTLNAYGGTEVFQIPPSMVDIRQGFEYVSCLRLTDKGLYRWFASCCNTPIGNTVSSKLPFISLIHTFISPDQDLDSKIGPVIGSVNVKYALGELPQELKGSKSQFSIILRAIRLLLAWKLTGKSNPNPFFDKQGKTVVKPSIVK